MPTLRRLATAVASPVGLACAALAPLAVHWASGRTLAWLDTQRVFAPQRGLIEEALRSFRLPLWNPYQGAGMPLLADAIHGVLHPVSVMVAWLDAARGVDLLIAGHVACAALGAALLGRDLGASRAAAAAAGLVYGGAGFVLSMTGTLTFLASAGSLPFCLAGLRRVAASPGPGALLLGAAGTAALGLTGDAQLLLVAVALALALAFEAGGWPAVARTAAAAGVGLLLASIQLVPSAVNVPRTERAADLWVRMPRAWALEPFRLAEFLVPGLCRGEDPFADLVYGALAGDGRWPTGNLPMPFVQSVFVGVVPGALALVGARSGRRGKVLAALALALLWAALGTRLGADALLGHLPVWRAFRYSEKLVGPFTLLVALLGALGLDAVAERRAARRQVAWVAGVLGLVALASAGLAAGSLGGDLGVVAGGRVLRGAWHLLGALAGLGAWLLLRDRLGLAAGRAALVALAWAGVAAASPLALRPGDPEARLRSPVPDLVAEPPGPRLAVPHEPGPILERPGDDLADLAGRQQAALGLAAYSVRARLSSLGEYGAMQPRRLLLLTRAVGRIWPAVGRNYAATHVVVDPLLPLLLPELHALATEGGTQVPGAPPPFQAWAVPHRPWASFALGTVVAHGERTAVARTARFAAQRAPWVVIEGTGSFAAAPGRVHSIERGLEWLRIEAEAEGDATLVVAEAWWPGWEATLDGAATEIFPADALVRAVRWPAGRHVLEMRYRPMEVAIGWAATALGAALLAAWAWAWRRRGAPPASPVPASPPAPGVGTPNAEVRATTLNRASLLGLDTARLVQR